MRGKSTGVFLRVAWRTRKGTPPIGKPINLARETYVLDCLTVESHEAFLAIIRAFYLHIEFTMFTDNKGDQRPVSAIASNELSEDTKLGRWVAAILGHMPSVGEEVTVEDVLHKHCRVVVGHKSNSTGKIFANVVDVQSVGGERRSLKM